MNILPSILGVYSTYSGDEGCVEGVLREPEQDAGLPDPTVSDQEEFEQVVVGFSHLCSLFGLLVSRV